MYHVGELILYGNMGVCRVTDVKEMSYTGDHVPRQYYILKSLSQDCVISAPVRENKVFMRPIISKMEALSLIDKIPSMHAESYDSSLFKELTEHYQQSIETHDCRDLIEMTMSIYAKKQRLEQQHKKFGSIDERFMKKAEDLLFGELAAALEIPRDQVPGFIQERLACAQ